MKLLADRALSNTRKLGNTDRNTQDSRSMVAIAQMMKYQPDSLINQNETRNRNRLRITCQPVSKVLFTNKAYKKQQQAVHELDNEYRNNEKALQQQLADLREELANQTAQLATATEQLTTTTAQIEEKVGDSSSALEAVRQMTQSTNGARADRETKVHTSSQHWL